MKKTTVILIIGALVIAFGSLIFYGLKHTRGVPVVIEPQKVKLSIEAQYKNKEINLAKDIGENFWLKLPSKEITLMHQVMVLPWGKSLVSPIIVKAFHNKKDIYFYISYKDETEDRIIDANKFSDACAIMFPMKEDVPNSTIMMGFMTNSNIWQWKASRDQEYWNKIQQKSEGYADFCYPFEEKELFKVSKSSPITPVNDLMAIRIGTITPKEVQKIEGRGIWNNGIWQVVFKRKLEIENKDIDAIFKIGRKKLIAFAVWNGNDGDRGGRKSISDWVELVMK